MSGERDWVRVNLQRVAMAYYLQDQMEVQAVARKWRERYAPEDPGGVFGLRRLEAADPVECFLYALHLLNPDAGIDPARGIPWRGGYCRDWWLVFEMVADWAEAEGVWPCLSGPIGGDQ